MALVIGLTGGIGCGKTAVAEAFASLGIDVTDTDRLAHALTAPGQPGHALLMVMKHIAQNVADKADFIISTGDLVEPPTEVWSSRRAGG